MNTSYLLLGSNMGNRETLLSQAIQLIEKSAGTVIAKSSVYTTAPWGNNKQSDFLNQVICLETQLHAEKLLNMILEIEKELGRERNQKWEARTIDIDILFYNADIIRISHLTIPHPHLHERKFALVPLAEIAGKFIHPILKQSVKQLLFDCTDNLPVSPLSKA